MAVIRSNRSCTLSWSTANASHNGPMALIVSRLVLSVVIY
jgi:hypothetical protein